MWRIIILDGLCRDGRSHVGDALLPRRLRRAASAVVAAFMVLLGPACDSPIADEPSAATPPDPAAVVAALDAANQYLESREVEKASAILARLLETAPDEIRAHELMGQALTIEADRAMRSGDAEQAGRLRKSALAQYEIVLASEPDSAGLQHSTGMMAVMAGEPDRAIACFERAAELEPTDPQHPIFAAQLHIGAKRLEAARTHLERAFALDPDEPLVHASLAIVALEEGDHAAAMRHADEAHRIAPDDDRFRVQAARVHRRTGAPEQGLELLIGLEPSRRETPAVAEELAMCFAALGRHSESARLWAVQFERRRGSSDAARLAALTGDALRQAGRREEALEWLAEAQGIDARQKDVAALASALSQR